MAKRKLKSGREVPNFTNLTQLNLETHCPNKWVGMDLETGHIWVGSPNGWKSASMEQKKEMLRILKQTIEMDEEEENAN